MPNKKKKVKITEGKIPNLKDFKREPKTFQGFLPKIKIKDSPKNIEEEKREERKKFIIEEIERTFKDKSLRTLMSMSAGVETFNIIGSGLTERRHNGEKVTVILTTTPGIDLPLLSDEINKLIRRFMDG